MYQKKRDGIYFNEKMGRVVEHRGYSTRIFWNPEMLTYLRRHFPTTLNEELAGCLGVGVRTMIHKARELGLVKDPAWLKAQWDERRKLAHIASKRKGFPGRFVKGQHANPDGEFKPGHQLTEEQAAKKSESLRKWHRNHPKTKVLPQNIKNTSNV